MTARSGARVYRGQGPQRCECVFCGASGVGPTGWTDVCPTCQDAPLRQARCVEAKAAVNAMYLEAFGLGLPVGVLVWPAP